MISKRSNAIVAACFLFVAILLPSEILAAKEETPQFSEVESDVTWQLLDEEKNLIDWAAELSKTEPTAPRDAMVKISVCLRAGLYTEASETVRILRRLMPEITSSDVSRIFLTASHRREAWSVCLATVEAFDYRINKTIPFNEVIRYYRIRRTDGPLWSDDQFVEWLGQRVASVAAYDREHPRAINLAELVARRTPTRSKTPIAWWRHLWLHELAGLGRAKEEIARQEAAVRADPENFELVLNYLESLATLEIRPGHGDIDQLDWLPGVWRSDDIGELKSITIQLVLLKQAAVAETYIRRAIELDAKASEARADSQESAEEKRLNIHQTISLHSWLNVCLLAQDKDDEVAKLREKIYQMRVNAGLTKPTLSRSGRAACPPGANPMAMNLGFGHWYDMQIAKYCPKEEGMTDEEAMRAGLARLRPPLENETPESIANARSFVVEELFRLLTREKRPQDAIDLLIEELKIVPADSESARTAALKLAKMSFNPKETAIWQWLNRRSEWGYSEKSFILRTLEKVDPPSREKCYAFLERIATKDGVDVSKAMTLGEVMLQRKRVEFSVRAFEHAIKNTTNEKLRQRAGEKLLEAHIQQDDWRSAEVIYGHVYRSMRPNDAVYKLAQIASIASKTGDLADAMRLWRRSANCDLAAPVFTPLLSKYGLQRNLRAYYNEAKRRLPTAELEHVLR